MNSAMFLLYFVESWLSQIYCGSCNIFLSSMALKISQWNGMFVRTLTLLQLRLPDPEFWRLEDRVRISVARYSLQPFPSSIGLFRPQSLISLVPLSRHSFASLFELHENPIRQNLRREWKFPYNYIVRLNFFFSLLLPISSFPSSICKGCTRQFITYQIRIFIRFPERDSRIQV